VLSQLFLIELGDHCSPIFVDERLLSVLLLSPHAADRLKQVLLIMILDDLDF